MIMTIGRIDNNALYLPGTFIMFFRNNKYEIEYVSTELYYKNLDFKMAEELNKLKSQILDNKNIELNFQSNDLVFNK